MAITLSDKQIKAGWQVVKFAEIAKNISKRVDPTTTDLAVYVGLEHLDPQSLRIQRRGVPSDVKGQKLRVRPGQIIFGKRRAYQKKLAVADFDGICSAHAMVLEEIPDKIIPGLLPFFMQSDMFMDRAVAISEGSLSPTIKWKTLAIQEFPLPPLERQKGILEVFNTFSITISKKESIIESLQILLTATSILNFNRARWDILFKVKPILTGKEFLLDQIAQRVTGHTPDKKKDDYWNGGIKWVSLKDTFRLDNIFIFETCDEVSPKGLNNSSAVKHPKGTVVLSRDAGVGKSAILGDDMAVSQHFVGWKCSEHIDSMYLYFWLQHMKPVFEAIAIGSTIKTIGMPFFKSLKIILPGIGKQKRIALAMQDIVETKDCIEKSLCKAIQMRQKVSQHFFLGERNDL